MRQKEPKSKSQIKRCPIRLVCPQKCITVRVKCRKNKKEEMKENMPKNQTTSCRLPTSMPWPSQHSCWPTTREAPRGPFAS